MFSVVIPIRKKDIQMETLECNGLSLLERKILCFQQIEKIQEVIVASDSIEIQKIVTDNFKNIKFYLRNKEETKDSLENFIENVVKEISNPYIIWTSCMNPFLDKSVFSEAMDEFLEMDFNVYDSLITCYELKKYILDENGPLNFQTGHFHVHSNNLPTLYCLVNGCFIMEAKLVKKYKYPWGKVPYKKILDQSLAFEIKNEKDFIFFKEVLDGKKGK
ncbi:hypothetical protein BXA15_00015 [Campylobacter lari]|nr:hypothetical protein [Campylobacter lari]ECQ7481136.1 hypothetical protein [Campylobacter coli]EAK9999109.1 hypothetical protein [Campylobacter lari]EBF6065440.1 hypothetical protein [Campylobacter lari]ECQ8910901.1 hypothetical protein [Campylobacter coli]